MSTAAEQKRLHIRAMDAEEIGIVSAILEEAALWLKGQGMEMWTESQYSSAGLLKQYSPQEIYLGFLGEQPAAAMVLMEEDPFLWPDTLPGEALYLHKLAVRRAYAGQGLSSAMLDGAIVQAGILGRRFVRLDCAADRPKLCGFYERAGFVKAGESLMLGKYPTALYECLVR